MIDLKNTTTEDAAIIMKIAKRAVRIAKDAGIPYKFQDAQGDGYHCGTLEWMPARSVAIGEVRYV